MAKRERRERRVLLWRILLGILIVCNMAVIFLFSSQNAADSSAISKKVVVSVVEMISKWTKKEPPPEETTPDETTPDETTPEETTPEETTSEETTPEETTPDETTPDESTPEETTVPEEAKPKDPAENLTEEQKVIVSKAHTPIRKLAHMLEFGSLASLALLFLITWPGKLLWHYAASLGFALVYAATDELHQLFSEGRGARLSDVFVDFAGAFIACTLLLAIVVSVRRSKRLVTTYYDLPITPCNKPLRIGLVADLHGCPYEKLVERLRVESPDIILLVGDVMEDTELADGWASGYAFLRACAEIAPTYYSLGNHETVGTSRQGLQCTLDIPTETRTRVAKTGVTLLHNESVLWNGIRICGLTSGQTKKENRPREEALAEFAAAPEFRILLCHHPEYYEPYIRSTNIELTVCGHAHGGQWRFFGRGVYAPGQGIFPKYTAGVIDDRLVISRGAGDNTIVPRICNPREIVIIRCGSKTENK